MNRVSRGNWLYCLISVPVVLCGAVLVRDCQTNFKSCRKEQLELPPFLIMRFAQVICWMNLAGKGYKPKD